MPRLKLRVGMIAPLAASLVMATATPIVAQERGQPTSTEEDAVVIDDVASSECTISGTDADEYILGTDGDDVICAGGGDDVIASLGGSDVVWAGPGADVVSSASSTTVLADFDPRDDAVASDSAALSDQESRPARRIARTLTEHVSVKGISSYRGVAAPEVMERIADEADAVASLPFEPLPERTAREKTEDDRLRGLLGFEPTARIDSDKVLSEAAANGSVATWGVPLTDAEFADVGRRSQMSEFVAPVRDAAASKHGLRSGVFFDLRNGQVVVNVPASKTTPSQLNLDVGLPAGAIAFRSVPMSLEELDVQVAPIMERAAVEAESIGATVKAAFDQSDYRYTVRIGIPDSKPTKQVQDLVDRLQGSSDFVEFRVDASQDTAGDPFCHSDACYVAQPGMKMAKVGGTTGCSMGLIVNYSGGVGVMSSEHCSQTSYVLRRAATPDLQITVNETNIQKNDEGTGTDHEIYSVVETARSGEAKYVLMNSVLAMSWERNNILSGTLTVAEEDFVCKTGYKSQELYPQTPFIACGFVDDLGDLAPGLFSSGYIYVPNMSNCKGDSGGPVWKAVGSSRYAVGLTHGVGDDGFDFPVSGGTCGYDTEYADINRALSDSNASFRNPGGEEMSRREAIRYSEIFNNQEPDYAVFYNYDGYCNLTYMRDVAYVFTVSGNNYNTTFEQRFPLGGGTFNSRERVKYLFWGLLDRDASAGDLNYWGNTVIWQSSSTSVAAREAAYDWLAWAMITNQGLPEFSTVRMTNTGYHGAPPMCTSGW
jgi:hypothetical protein